MVIGQILGAIPALVFLAFGLGEMALIHFIQLAVVGVPLALSFRYPGPAGGSMVVLGVLGALWFRNLFVLLFVGLPLVLGGMLLLLPALRRRAGPET